MDTKRQHIRFPSVSFFAFVLSFSMIWSSAFIAGKLGLQYADPYTLLVARFTLAAFLLLPLCCRKGNNLFADRNLIRDASLLGILNNALYLGLTFTALRYISAGMVIIIVSCAPFAATLVAGLLRIEVVSRRKITGIIIGFCGVLIITLARPVGDVNALGLGLAALGSLSFAVATVFYRNKAGRYPPQCVNFWQSLIAALLLIPPATISSSPVLICSPGFIGATTYLAVVVTIGGMWMWLFLIRCSGAGTAATYHLANPVCGMLLSHLVFGTGFHIYDWLGIAIVMLGLFIVSRPGQISESDGNTDG